MRTAIAVICTTLGGLVTLPAVSAQGQSPVPVHVRISGAESPHVKVLIFGSPTLIVGAHDAIGTDTISAETPVVVELPAAEGALFVVSAGKAGPQLHVEGHQGKDIKNRLEAWGPYVSLTRTAGKIKITTTQRPTGTEWR